MFSLDVKKYLLSFILIPLSSNNSDLIELSASVISVLAFGSDSVHLCFELGIQTRLFQLINTENSLTFNAQKEIFRAICQFMISADLVIAKELVENLKFIDIMKNLIEVMYEYIPFEIIDSLIIIQRFYELKETDWYIWENDEIVEYLEKIKNLNFPNDPNYEMSINDFAETLLSRQNNK